MRIALIVTFGVLAAAAFLLVFAGCIGPAAGIGVWALLLLIGLAVERWRYKPLAEQTPGPDWAVTGERFIDPESGRMVTVYFHAGSGERRYVAR
ncbi:MAG TPA: hypothetical protein VHY35_01770 [Stellaceae bacterium]|jgi:hypothetical protein|nr:hypothetical protein [Stellaceae bacterium]